MPEDAVVAPTARRQPLRRGQAAVVLLAAGALLGLAACASTGQTVSADLRPTATSRPAAEPRDECDLISPSEARQLLGEAVEVAHRMAAPHSYGGWMYECVYLSRHSGVNTARLRIIVDTLDPGRSEPEPGTKRLSGLGGVAWAGGGKADLLRDGGWVQVTVESGTSAPDAAERALRKIASRLPTVPAFPRSDVSGVCARLDIHAVERLAGKGLPGRRSAVRANGGARCVFGGADVRFDVTFITDPKEIQQVLSRSDGVPVRGLPVKASLLGPEIRFVIDERLYAVKLVGADAVLLERTELPKLVVEAFEACGDDLAGC